MIRQAKPTDTTAILDIYSPYIRDTSITFETEVPSKADFEKRDTILSGKLAMACI